MKGIILVIVLLPALTLADIARIATWNLGGFHQIPQTKIANIIEGIKKLHADIIVLPEINPLSHGQAIADALSAPTDSCYKSAVPDQPKARQEIGFIYKCDVEVASPGLIIGSDISKQGYRNAAAIQVKIDQFDIVLIGLHLKAGRGSSNRSWRDQQLEIISGYVQGILIAGEKDVLVIGDYNMISEQDADNFETLNADSSMRYVSNEDLSGQGSYIRHTRNRQFARWLRFYKC